MTNFKIIKSVVKEINQCEKITKGDLGGWTSTRQAEMFCLWGAVSLAPYKEAEAAREDLGEEDPKPF